MSNLKSDSFEPPGRLLTLNLLGLGLLTEYQRTGDSADLERAIEALERAVEQTPPGSSINTRGLTNLGGALIERYERTGNPANLERAIEATERTLEQFQPGEVGLSSVLTALGMQLVQRYQQTHDLADLEHAIEVYEQAIEHAQPGTARLPYSLGSLSAALEARYRRAGDPADLERSIEVVEKAIEQLQPGSIAMSYFLNTLGGALIERYEQAGNPADLEHAIEVTEQAVEQFQPSSPYLPYCLYNLSKQLIQRYERTSDPADLERSIEVAEKAIEQLQPGSPDLPYGLYLLGLRLWARFTRTNELSDLEKIIDTWEEAWSLLQTTFAASPVGYKIGQQSSSAPHSAMLIEAHLKWAQVNQSEATAACRRALVIAEGSKSRLLTEVVGRADLPPPLGISPRLVDRERELLAELTNLDVVALAAYGLSVTSHEEVNHYVLLQRREERLQELEDLWTQMSQAGSEAADYVALRRGTPVTWEDLARLASDLGAETALISFFTTEERALLFIVRDGWEEPEVVETDFGQWTWTDTMKRLFREIQTSRGSTRRDETWHRPLKKLLEKAKPHLGGVTRVVFAPYSEGHRIPWSVVAERAGWRNPNHQILPLVTLPALGLLSRLRNRPLQGNGLALVAGNPLGDLEYAEEEAREVAAMLGAKPLLGPQATKAQVQTSISQATVAHMATHAYFDLDSPLDSGVLLADRGVLTAREVMNERLRADLLVLSACETGMSHALGGDELAGLGQAFLQGGARSVIVSLWRVNDSATAALMKAFYEAYRAEVDKAQALSQAMTQVQEQEKWHHPYYWGAFVLMGDW